jgi:hypothetical protein
MHLDGAGARKVLGSLAQDARRRARIFAVPKICVQILEVKITSIWIFEIMENVVVEMLEIRNESLVFLRSYGLSGRFGSGMRIANHTGQIGRPVALLKLQ